MSKLNDSARKAVRAFGALLGNVDLSQVPEETIEWINQHPSDAGKELTKWMLNGCRLMIGEPKVIKINPPKEFNPTKFIGQDWTIWKGPKTGDGLKGKEEVDGMSLTLTEVDLSKVILETSLKSGEGSITGEEKLVRLNASGRTLLGGNVFLSLWEDYQANKENSCLEWLRKNRGVTYVDFFGLVLRRPSGGCRCVLYLYWSGDQWLWSCHWLDDDWDAEYVSAVLAD